MFKKTALLMVLLFCTNVQAETGCMQAMCGLLNDSAKTPSDFILYSEFQFNSYACAQEMTDTFDHNYLLSSRACTRSCGKDYNQCNRECYDTKSIKCLSTCQKTNLQCLPTCYVDVVTKPVV